MLLPLFPLNLVLFPGGPLPLRIFETRYVDMVRRCMRESSDFGVVLITEGQEAGPAQTREVGTTAKIVDFHQLSDGLLGLSCVGQRKFSILGRHVQSDGLNIGEVELLELEPTVDVPLRFASLAELVQGLIPQLGEAYAGMPLHINDSSWIGCRLAEILPMEPEHKQYCLEMSDPIARLDYILPMIKFSAEGSQDDDDDDETDEDEGAGTPSDTH